MVEQSIARVTNVAVEDIAPNPHNPRRLFDEEPMRILQESIQELGVLVPITVYERKKTSVKRTRTLSQFVLLDGERRWRCVRNLGRTTIPAIIVEEPSDVNNILTMFHIHNVREGWQLMPTALKLHTLMAELKTTNERQLASLTQLSISQIRRCKILLSFDVEYQDMMLAPQSRRLKADFFIELERIRGPALEQRLSPWIDRGDKTCIDILLEKYHSGVISAVTEFRDLAAKYRGADHYGHLDMFCKELDGFFETRRMKIDEIYIPEVGYHKAASELRRTSNRLVNQLKELDDEALAADEELVKLLYDLAKMISERLSETLVIEARNEFS